MSTEPTDPVRMLRAEDRAARMASLERMFGGTTRRPVIAHYSTLDLPIEGLRLVEALADWALETGTGISRHDDDPVYALLGLPRIRPVEARDIAGDLLTAWLRLDRQFKGLDLDAAPWIAVMAGAPNRLLLKAVQDVATSDPGYPAPEFRTAWQKLGPAGLMAFAAGLSLDEAQQRAAAGTLDADGLAVLAGLRGWRFPPQVLWTTGQGEAS